MLKIVTEILGLKLSNEKEDKEKLKKYQDEGNIRIFENFQDFGVLKDKFTYRFGMQSFGDLIFRPVEICEYEDTENETQSILTNHRNHVNTVVGLGLWLIKDHSISIDHTYLFNFEKSILDRQINHPKSTKSDGSIEISTISPDEILTAYDYLESLQTILNPLPQYNFYEENGFIPSQLSRIPYNIFNNFNRAVNFINFARKSSNILYKISWYIVTLEAIFVRKKREPKFESIKTRIQKLLEIEQNHGFIQILKDAYILRSTYIHGDEIPKDKIEYFDLNYQKQVSQVLDDLIRRIFVKVITEERTKKILLDLHEFYKYF